MFNSDTQWAAESFSWASRRWESICFSEATDPFNIRRAWKMWHWATSKIKGSYYNRSISKWNVLAGVDIYKYVLTFIYVRVCVCVCVGPVHISTCVRFQTSTSASLLYPLAPRVCVCVCAQSLLGSHRVNRARQTSALCVCLPANPRTSHPSFRVRYQAYEMNTHPQSMGFHLKARGINARPFCTPPTL